MTASNWGAPNLVGNRLTIGLQACDVDLDGLDRSLGLSAGLGRYPYLDYLLLPC